MTQAAIAPIVDRESARCPYCGDPTPVSLPRDYAPSFVFCAVCGLKFIAERLAVGFQVMTVEAAPCSSNPDCRELEMGAYDEE